MALIHMPHLMLAVALLLTMSGVGSANVLGHRRLLAGISNTTESEEFLSVHNAARAAVGVPPLRWSPKLAMMADRLARRHKGCGSVKVNDNKFGSNEDLNGDPVGSPRLAVEGWVQLKEYYHHANNTCDNESCRMYLQIVWRKTLALGCKRVVCPKSTGEPPVVVALSLCLYSPPGNVKGEIPY